MTLNNKTKNWMIVIFFLVLLFLTIKFAVAYNFSAKPTPGEDDESWGDMLNALLDEHEAILNVSLNQTDFSTLNNSINSKINWSQATNGTLALNSSLNNYIPIGTKLGNTTDEIRNQFSSTNCIYLNLSDGKIFMNCSFLSSFTEADPYWQSNFTNGYNKTAWDLAYSWDNHALAGYLTSESDPKAFNGTLAYNSSLAEYYPASNPNNYLVWENVTNGTLALNSTLGNLPYVSLGTKLGNTTEEIRNQFSGSTNISIIDGIISINDSFLKSETDPIWAVEKLTYINNTNTSWKADTLAQLQATVSNDFHNLGGIDNNCSALNSCSDIIYYTNGSWVLNVQAYGVNASTQFSGHVSGTYNAISVINTAGLSGENITSGTVADARIASTITRDSEVTSLESDPIFLTQNQSLWDAINTKLQIGSDATLGKTNFTNDVYFNSFKAIALSADNGATLPTNASLGQWFLQNTTGRTVLMQYDGSAWIPIYAYGSTELYVNNYSGTDSQNLGNGTGTDAFKTLQFTFNQIPPLFSGNILIHVDNETYVETAILQGKNPTGSYTITIDGETVILYNLTATGGNAGIWSVGGNTQYQVARIDVVEGTLNNNMSNGTRVRFINGSNAGLIRQIDTTTTSNITLIGKLTATPSNGDNFVIERPLTTFTDLRIGYGQTAVIINDTKFNFSLGTNNAGLFGAFSEVTLNHCDFLYSGGGSNSIWLAQNVKATLNDVYSIYTRWFFRGGSKVLIGFSKLFRGSVHPATIQIDESAVMGMGDGTIIDCGDIASSYGVRILGEATINWNGGIASNTIYPKVRNCAIGISSEGAGYSVNTYNWYVLMGDDIMPNNLEQNTQLVTNALQDTSVNFTQIGVNASDRVILVNGAVITQANVIAKYNDTFLNLSNNIFTSTGIAYRILNGSSLNIIERQAKDGGIIDAYGGLWDTSTTNKTLSGNLGLGTTAPSAILHIDSSNSGAYFQEMIRISRTSTSDALRLLNYDGNTQTFNLQYSNDLTNWFNLIVFRQDGSVGIGNITPTSTLSVSGNANITSTLDVGSGGLEKQALCWKTSTRLGYCTSGVNSTGGCTCV